MKKIYYLNYLLILLFSIQVYGNNRRMINKDIKTISTLNTSHEESLILEDDTVEGVVFESLNYSVKIKNGSLNDISDIFITRGTLPEGITLDKNYLGKISGVPLIGGTFIVYIKVKNINGESNEAKITFNIKKINYIIDPIPFGDPQIRCRVGEKIELPEEEYNISVPFIYESNNEKTVKIDKNILECINIGSVVVTAKLDENDQYETNSSTFKVDVIDPNDSSKSYIGIGKFKLVTNIEEFTDGYYVIASGNYSMSNILDNKELKSKTIQINNDKIIINPDRNIVWEIKTTPDSGELSSNIQEVTIYNQDIEKYLKGGYDYLDFNPFIRGDYNFWNIKENETNKNIELLNFSIGEILFKNSIDNVFINNSNSDKDQNLQNLQFYKLIDSSLSTDNKNISHRNDIKIYKKKENNIEIKSENLRIKSLIIYDISGKLLIKLNDINQKEYEINKPLKKGVYIFNVQLENGKIFNQKIMN